MFCRYVAVILSPVLIVSALFAADQRREFLDAPSYAVLPNPTVIAVGDFDGDGKPDIVEAGQGITTLLGNGDGTFRTGKNSVMTQTPNSIAVADFNQDGKLDLVTTDFMTNVSILLGNGDGSFQQFTNYPAGNKPTAVAVQISTAMGTWTWRSPMARS